MSLSNTTTAIENGGRVMSIQSHTVRGYVGNKSAVFPLQLLGFDVDPINSVQFSNHTGYPTWKGEVLNGDQLWDLIEGLQGNGLLSSYTHLLTGYIGSASFLRTVVRTVSRLREDAPDLTYVCDPVMGDESLYVPKELVAIYRDEVVPIASVITPNQFEAELLTGIAIKCEADAVAVCEALHAKGPRTVFLTSLELEGEEGIVMMASRVSSQGPEAETGTETAGGGGGVEGTAPNLACNGRERHTLVVPRLRGNYTGTGDLSAALLLAWTHRRPGDLRSALEMVGATMTAVLQRTLEESGPGSDLRLVQSAKSITDPCVRVRANSVHS